MGLHTSILMIEGNYLSRLDKIFKDFEYLDTGNDREVTNWDDMIQILSNWELSQSRVLKATCLQQGWSVIFDPEMVMFADEERCSKVSSGYKTRLFGMICESTSGTYGFNLYDNQKVRGFLSVDGEVFEDYGMPLQEEAELDKLQVFASDILKIMKGIGVDYNRLEMANRFIVKELDEVKDSASTMNTSKPTLSQSQKSWWRFWK